MLASIPSRLLSEWMLFAQIEPFGEERADRRAGIVASTVANVNRDPKIRREPWRADDFMPQYDREDEPVPEQPKWMQMLATVEMWNAALGGQDLRPSE